MYTKLIIILLSTVASVVVAQPGKCDQMPPQAKVLTPSENKGTFKMSLVTKEREAQNLYLPDQTYVLILSTTDDTRPFRWFMITAEDPDVDNSTYEFNHKAVDVGSLKTLDTDRQTRYSERCYSSVENTDNSDKYQVEVHWISPEQNSKSQKVRLRAMIAENEEVWYTGENLTIVLEKNDHRPIDSPPYLPSKICNLCSEARYEVTFKGQWSRVSHPRHYPSKPDDNGYSHMVGASHSYEYTLWQQGIKASRGLKQLAEEANSTSMERDIIEAISMNSGTRTLIRGKRRHHPHMFEPSHANFRVDRIHHLFSIVVAMKPSPDWFLGASKFELCTDLGWLEYSEIPLFPWDAGTMDGVSYESLRTMTQPVDNVERVAMGSFNRESPFYQLNINDLKPFALLEVKRLDVYPLVGVECNEEEKEKATQETAAENEEEQETEVVRDEEIVEEPKVAEYRQQHDLEEKCDLNAWGEWSPCVPDEGECGIGKQTRKRYKEKNLYQDDYENQDDLQLKSITENCQGDASVVQSQHCFVDCF